MNTAGVFVSALFSVISEEEACDLKVNGENLPIAPNPCGNPTLVSSSSLEILFTLNSIVNS